MKELLKSDIICKSYANEKWSSFFSSQYTSYFVKSTFEAI